MLVGFSLTAIALANREVVAHRRTNRLGRYARGPAGARGGAACCLHMSGAVGGDRRLAAGAACRSGAGGEPSITVAAVQGNVPRLGLDFNAQRRAVLDNHVRETMRLAEDVRAGTAPQPQFVDLAGECVGHRPSPQRRRGVSRSRRPRNAIGAPILVGTVLEVPRPTRRTTSNSTNTVIVWNPVTGPGRPPRQADRAAIR